MARQDVGLEFPENPFRVRRRDARPLIGLWSTLNSTNAVEGLSAAGFDWMLLDGEHAPMSLADTVAHLRAIQGAPCAPIVRLVWNDPILIKQYLDIGAATIMLPYIQTAAEAEAAVRAMRYPPRGTRGVALLHRASRYGRITDYMQRADEGLFLIVQIETRRALDHLEQIAAVDGVDAIFLGPGDLAASLGVIGHPDHPDVTALIDDALRRGRKSGKAVGVFAPNAVQAERHIRSGFDFVSVASDLGILLRTAEQTAAQFVAIAQGETTLSRPE
jgi:2-keto-3-deoxy-L-rhamnonate aldolase RhmA